MSEQKNNPGIDNLGTSPESLDPSALAEKILTQLSEENTKDTERARQLINEEVIKQGKEDDFEYYYKVRFDVMEKILFKNKNENISEEDFHIETEKQRPQGWLREHEERHGDWKIDEK
ncbi:MAG: hypothetical protein WCV55_03400 [Candidatus Paceibacterota bacterium]